MLDLDFTQVERGTVVGGAGVAGVPVKPLINNRRGVGSVTVLLPVSVLRANIVQDTAAKDRIAQKVSSQK